MRNRLRLRVQRRDRRRAMVAVQVAVGLTALVGFAALTIDVGAMYSAKADLQRCADAAALAAASRLASFDLGDPQELARAEAIKFAAANGVFGKAGKATGLDPSDIVFGRAVLSGGVYGFQPTSEFPDSVRVRVRLDDSSPNGALGLYFARIFGYDKKDLEAEAVAMMIPRDIAIVADLSGSHTDDSELGYYKRTTINLFDVWDNFPGGIGDVGTSWVGNEFPLTDGYSPQMAGPAWGFMKTLGYGTEVVDASYNPSSDPGLVHLPKGADWTNTQLRNALLAQQYSTAEVNAIMSKAKDSGGYWDERVAVALGLAEWNSGMSGGRWSKLGQAKVGNANTTIASNEITWTERFGNRSVSESANIWKDWINNYVNQTWSEMYKENSAFRYRFGVKTFVNYLLERRPSHSQTPELANVPTQPMQAVKDGVQQLIDTMSAQESDDRISLEIYGETARHEVDLTNNFEEISNRLNEMQAGHYDTWTNMGGGILRGIEELTNTNSGADGARPTARKIMFLLTDGQANVTKSGAVGDYVGGKAYAEEMAALAISKGIRIFTVSVGSDSDVPLMEEIAAQGSGLHFHAEGDISTYSAQLQEIFATLGGARPVALIK